MAEKRKLKRGLNLMHVFCVASGAMISSGLFVLPGLAHALTGPSVFISYILAGLLAMTGMLSQAELVSAMPKAGGDYFYVMRSMGPAVGTIEGLLTWMSITLKSSFALVGMAAFTVLVVDLDPRMIALLFCLFFLFINFIGIKEAGIIQVGLVTVLLGLLVVYIVMGLPKVATQNFKPFMPQGFDAVLSTAGFIFISYGGLLKVASIAEEVKNPGRTIPLGMILSLIVVSIFYALTVFVTTGVLPGTELDHSLTPISDGAAVFMGGWGVLAMGIAAILAFVSTANAGIMAASRYPFALSRDHLLPDALSSVHRRFKTPTVAIATTGLLMISALFLDLYLLVEVASTVLIMTFMFSCLCVIIMRESGVQNYQPRFRSPLYPWIQVAGIIGCWLLVVNMGKKTLFIASLLLVSSIAVFWFYGRRRVKRDFALLHLIERVAAREFIDISLESELKEIIRERDDIIKDRFDRVVEESIVIDVKGSISMEEFYDLVSRKMAPMLKMGYSEIIDLLIKREKQASTVLAPGLAIPHIIIDGEHKFIMLLARAREGITFPGAEKKVHTVFVIMGTRDERPFHLRALSAIAQISEDPNFGKKWMAAKSEESLRDIILLGKRKRQK